MPYYFCFFFILFTSCIDKQPSKQISKPIVIKEDSVLRVNDTICTIMHEKNDYIMGVNFCYIRFGDSLGRSTLNHLYNSGYESKVYNVEPDENKDLVYQNIGDTIEIKIYYSTNDRKYLIEADSIILEKGIVYLKEKYSQQSIAPKTFGITLDEVVYKFLLKKGSQPRFRHLWGLGKVLK